VSIIGGIRVGQRAVSALSRGHSSGNFGLMHAHSLACGSQSIGTSWVRNEYGDPFDMMGAVLHSQRLLEERARIPAGRTSRQTAGSGTYTLSPLGSREAEPRRADSDSVGRTYWLEFRQPVGVDAGLSGNPVSGALVRIGEFGGRHGSPR
jgi:hypothetical protein